LLLLVNTSPAIIAFVCNHAHSSEPGLQGAHTYAYFDQMSKQKNIKNAFCIAWGVAGGIDTFSIAAHGFAGNTIAGTLLKPPRTGGSDVLLRMQQ